MSVNQTRNSDINRRRLSPSKFVLSLTAVRQAQSKRHREKLGRKYLVYGLWDRAVEFGLARVAS